MGKNKFVRVLLGIVLCLLALGVYYYIALPAINIHATGFWTTILFMIGVLFLITLFRNNSMNIVNNRNEIDFAQIKMTRLSKVVLGVGVLVGIVYIGGSILGSPLINAKQYQELLTVEERNFDEDVAPVDYTTVPILDKNSAVLLGDRKMGSMVEFVSQFTVGLDYTQINYQGKPVRVTPLEYESTFKWFTNQADGIPAYIMIDMASQETEVVMLEEEIMYSKSELFNRNIYRHLRFNFPTYIFDEEIFFEIDEEGHPYWVCPVKQFEIGLFGGQTVGRVVIVDAVTGEVMDYAVDEVPDWVDKVYRAELLVQLYDFHGVYVNGYWNSVLGQRGCLQTTNNYNYLTIDNDVWVYTGVTSLAADQANVGFVLMNQRTMETRYYVVEGAIEDSAMVSAEGQVQNLGYQATFPLLLNIEGEPTYFMALKDMAGLVKKYAMVNVQQYQVVAIGDTVKECEASYKELMADSGMIEYEEGSDTEEVPPEVGVTPDPIPEPEAELETKEIVILDVYALIVEGNSHIYFFVEEEDVIYSVDITEGNLVDARNYVSGDVVQVTYEVSDDMVKKVTDISR